MTCPTPCDPDCPEPCHEVHEVKWKRTHDPATCHIERGWWVLGDFSLHGPGDDCYDLLWMAIEDSEMREWFRRDNVRGWTVVKGEAHR